MNAHANLAASALLAVLLASCSFAPETNRYQSPDTRDTAGQGAVDELQRNAVAAFERQAYQQAIEYLQRAIRIEPRNPRSWHYLAQTYWQRGELDRCIEMVERSFSYSRADDGLDHANAELKARCQ